MRQSPPQSPRSQHYCIGIQDFNPSIFCEILKIQAKVFHLIPKGSWLSQNTEFIPKSCQCHNCFNVKVHVQSLV